MEQVQFKLQVFSLLATVFHGLETGKIFWSTCHTMKLGKILKVRNIIPRINSEYD